MYALMCILMALLVFLIIFGVGVLTEGYFRKKNRPNVGVILSIALVGAAVVWLISLLLGLI